MVNILRGSGYSTGPALLGQQSVAPVLTNAQALPGGIIGGPGLYVPASSDTPPSTFPFWQWDWTRDTGPPAELSISRSTVATYLAAGVRKTAGSNGPRLEYDGAGNPLGFLIESEQRTNYRVDSDNVTGGSWSLHSCSVVVSATQKGADATTGMVLMTASAVTADNPCVFTGAGLGGNTPANTNAYIVAEFKAGTNNFAQIDFYWDAGGGTNVGTGAVIFDLTDGSTGQTATRSAGTGTTPTITSTSSYLLRDGIWRCEVIAQCAMTANNWVTIGPAKAKTGNATTASGILAFTGTYAGTETIYIGGCDWQISDFRSSHIVATSAAVTRSADIVSTTNAALLAAQAWEIETGELQINGAARTIMGVNTVTALGVTTGNALTTADGGTQTTTDTGTWTGKNRAGLAWTP
jgi:hypothetical protein